MMKRVLLFFIVLDICGISVFGQFVTLEGRQFKDTNGVALYPLVCNYLTSMPYEDTIDYNFLITPAHHYGLLAADDFYPMDSAIVRIHNDFNEIKNMGFNTIRLMNMLAKNNPIPATPEKHNDFYPGFHSIDCKYDTSWITPVNHRYLFNPPYNTCGILATLLHQYRQIIRIAAEAGLYVILVPAGGNELFRNSFTVNDYADLLMEFCDTLKNVTNLLAYDFVNEPEWTKRNHTKGEICDFTSQIYDAIHSVDTNHLVTIGGTVAGMSGVFEWDPSVMKIDFWSPHTYIDYNPRLPVSLNTGLESVTNTIIWIQNNCPIPWIIGETGFVAEDFYNLSVVWGTENEQSIYASKTLDTVRNAGGSGYSWWMFQHVGWHGTITPPPKNAPNHHFGTDDYYRDVNGYYQDNFGLLGVGNPSDCSPTTHECNYSLLEKPVVEVFQNYLNPDPPDPGPPPVPNNYGVTGNNPNHPNKITGRIVDQNNVPIKDAVIKGNNFVKELWLDVGDTKTDTNDHTHENLFNVQYTFSDENGNFTFIPYDYVDPVEYPNDPHNNYEFFIQLAISCVGCEKYVIGRWAPNNLSIRFDYAYDLYNFSFDPIHLYRNGYGFEYDKVVSNKTIDITSAPVIFSAWNKLTLNNVTVNGNGTQGGIADFTARSEVQVNKEFDAQRGSEVHIYNSEVFRNCDSISSFKKRGYTGIGSNNQIDGSEEREIELSFFKERKGISVYPNPTSGPLTVEIQNPASPYNNLVISDMYGNKILQLTCEKTSQLDLTGFPCGVYIISGYSEVEQFGSCKIVLY